LNDKIQAFKQSIKNKKIAVLGIGISNTPLIKYLCSMGLSVTAFDKSDKDKLAAILSEFDGLNVNYSLGEGYLSNLKGFDLIFRTPGMRFDIAELVRARERGAEITSEMEVFFDLCPAEIFAVTGSDGKTTTTTLIYNILMEQGYTCWLGGNIGIPLLSKVEEIEADHKVVLELSSFQLQTMKKSPHVAVITNVSPNHLDVHKSMEEYVDAKKNIFRFQTEYLDDNSIVKVPKLILNFDNEITKGFASEAKGDVFFFSRISDLKEGAVIENGKIVYKKNGVSQEIVDTKEIFLPGEHNIENYLAATAAVIDYVEPNSILKVATSFRGVEHRLEFVREINGVKFYNGSIDSSPSRTAAALSVFKDKVILIAGGKDKNIPYAPLGEVIAEKVKCLVLIGQTAPLIEKALRDAVEKTGKGKDIIIMRCNSYQEAVEKAYDNATEGDVILLSPASTSFDMFKNFEERGNTFKEIVNKLKTKL